MKWLSLFIAALLGGLVAAMVMRPDRHADNATSDHYTQVKESGTLRCGYIQYDPYFSKDPNTGKMSGIFYDITEEAARRLSLKVSWTEEVGWATFIEGIKTGRYDALCSGLSPSAAEGREVAYTLPVYYTAVSAYVRVDDTRFKSFEALNNPGVTISTMDGSLNSIIARTDFPLAKIHSESNMTDEGQMALNVLNGKADVNFMEVYRAAQFNIHNQPGLKNISPDKPLRVFPNMMALPMGDVRLQSMLNTALEELHSSGFVEQVLKKYENTPDAFLRIKTPYQSLQK